MRSASVYAPENCFKVSVSTSVVSHPPWVNDSRNDPYCWIIASTLVPKCSAVRFRAFWNSSPPMPALTTEFQSISETRPAAMACDNWYIACEAWAELEPDMAARLAMPLMESTDV